MNAILKLSLWWFDLYNSIGIIPIKWFERFYEKSSSVKKKRILKKCSKSQSRLNRLVHPTVTIILITKIVSQKDVYGW